MSASVQMPLNEGAILNRCCEVDGMMCPMIVLKDGSGIESVEYETSVMVIRGKKGWWRC